MLAIRMAYIEEEMKKRRGDDIAEGQESADGQGVRGYQDIYDELYKIPEHLRVRISQSFVSGASCDSLLTNSASRLTKSQ
jgi:hypothetical protein